MKKIGLTMRVETASSGERRDCIDQNWIKLLFAQNFIPVLIPNEPDFSLHILKEIDGLIFSGGPTGFKK